MSTTSHDQSGARERLLGRRRRLLLTALVLGVVLAGLGAFWWKHRPAVAEPPLVDLSTADPAVAEAVEAALREVRQAPRSGPAWGKLGMVLAAHGFASEARICFAQAEQLDPHDPRWPYYQAHILTFNLFSRPSVPPGGKEFGDDWAEALRKYQRAVDLFGDRFTAPRLRLGAALLDQGRVAEAEAQFRRVLDLEPGNPLAHLQLARVHFGRGDLKECLAHLRHATQAPFTRKAAHVLAAAVYERLGDPKASTRERELALELPDDVPMPDPVVDEIDDLKRGRLARLQRAEELLASGRIPEGVQWLRDLVQDYPDSSQAWLRLGRALLQQGDLAGAESALKTALEREPDLMSAHFYLGVVSFQGGDLPKAEAAFRRALALKPDFALAYFNLGQCLLRKGDQDGAREAFRAAVENSPRSAEAHAELAAVLARQGRTAEALEQAQDALRLDPANAQAQKVLQSLNQIP
jgi:tetratricopeptide (TPR) repeat protein